MTFGEGPGSHRPCGGILASHFDRNITIDQCVVKNIKNPGKYKVNGILGCTCPIYEGPETKITNCVVSDSSLTNGRYC